MRDYRKLLEDLEKAEAVAEEANEKHAQKQIEFQAAHDAAVAANDGLKSAKERLLEALR